MQPLPYPAASFDVVILSEVVEHLPEWLTVVREAGRVLRDGGALVLPTPNIASPLHTASSTVTRGIGTPPP